MATLIIITGMHRSGTSALCAALRACGVSFGEQLLSPMSGVNDEGFWEDRDVVALNERLLTTVGSCWFDISIQNDIDWRDTLFDECRRQAEGILRRGFGEGAVQAVKDPRFCITLAFWLQVCADAGMSVEVCAIDRAPMEVARSLQKRDAFPLAYGLRLYATYWQQLYASLPSGAGYVLFDELLADPVAVLSGWANTMPLTVNAEAVNNAVRRDLRHQKTNDDNAIYSRDLGALNAWIEQDYPLLGVAYASVQALVERGKTLTLLGEEHNTALATIDERDVQIAELDTRLATAGKALEKAMATVAERDEQLDRLNRESTAQLTEIGQQHSYALSVIDERDAQIADFDARLSRLGQEHSHALAVVRERDATVAEQSHALDDMQARLNRLLGLPVLGPVIRKLWFYEKR